MAGATEISRSRLPEGVVDMRTNIARRLIAVTGVVLLAGTAVILDAAPASAHQKRQEFSCDAVTETWTNGYCNLITWDGQVGWRVPDGHTLCFAVRDSAEHPIRFRATEKSGSWSGTTNRFIQAGDGKACLRTNDTGHTLLVGIWVRTNDGWTLFPEFTAYSCHPGNPCYE
jgi:hypothetical protein